MPGTSQTYPNATLTRVLLVASRWLIFIPIITTALLLSAGTFLYNAPYRPTVLSLGLRSLAMVSYDGIIPVNKTHSSDSPNYMVTIHKFPNAFSWECPDCPAVLYSPRGFVELAGVAETGPYAGYYPLTLMLHIADKLSGKNDSAFWHCYRDAPQPDGTDCPENVFFKGWTKSFHDFWLTGVSEIPISFITYIFCLVLAATTLVSEALITFAPRHMKCRCLVGKRWCPYPSGTADEIEALPEHRWDRVRMFTYPLLLAYLFLAAVQDTVMPMFFLSILNFIDHDLPKGMSMRPRQNRPYMVLLWLNVLVSGLAVACIAWRYHLNKPKGHITLDDLAAYEPEGRTEATAEPVAEASSVDNNANADESDGSESDVLLPFSDNEPITEDESIPK
ncbi:hypothetical protein MCOR31_008381 [Pyricularia oryzae]|nr:hypothetical protein MCOR31_008381 [Pyricularia oryzae]KAI6386321.1 hypothetical protein MCOR32_000943 [Pyricularia oryzae]KAI6427121.1 hypothetical protein MCOR21_006379 [Pyricularia oryzae]KAI6443636.1 hypothetical protein MCOR22_005265 [Pyricularia oryzae]KAI6467591.1 hypothetical protein MCOR15_002510 [Pyricularia oryzae]